MNQKQLHRWKSSVEDIEGILQKCYGVALSVAYELEWYFAPCRSVEHFSRWLDTQNFHYASCKPEEGVGQLEVSLLPARPLLALAECITLKEHIEAYGRLHGVSPIFDAMPAANEQPPSAMHVHVSMHNADDEPLYYKKDKDISDYLAWSIAGLLATMQEGMYYFAPNAHSHRRFACYSVTTPRTVSWGANNRTTALRLPDEGAPYRHIEHRVAGADANPHAVLYWIMHGIEYGLQHKPALPMQIYGDANKETHLEKLVIPA